jgi:hypothetical protein
MPRSSLPKAVTKRPEGSVTRGKTAPNRLRRVDNFIAMYDAGLLKRMDGDFAHAFFVDLGYGAEATTTLESAERYRRINPSLPVLGVEIDPERVIAAQPFVDALTSFRLGGFNLPLLAGETVRLIRAFNVLRQYEETDFAPAYERLGQYMLPGGLMIEGTSDPFGRIWVANVVRKFLLGDWGFEAIVFSTNFRSGFDPAQFQTVLPKNYIHHVVPGEAIFDFFEAWKRSAAETAHAKIWGMRQWFIAAAEGLAAKGYNVNLQRKWLAKGLLIWETAAVQLNREVES